jgi:hypothetical protein
MTPKDIASEIIWEGLVKDTGDPVSNVYRVCMDIQHYIIDWMEKERARERKEGKKQPNTKHSNHLMAILKK